MSGSIITGSVLSYGAATVNATVATIMVPGTAHEAEGLGIFLSIGMMEYALVSLSVLGVLVRLAFDISGFCARRRKRKH